MKKKTAVLVTAVVVLIALSMGCVEETTTTVSIEDEDDIRSNQGVSVNRTIEKHFFWSDREKTVVVGRLTGITFNYQNPDVLVFQDKDKKAVFCARYAEKFVWIVGENCKVTIMESNFDSSLDIIDVEIINSTQTTQQPG
jgi:hypothetical protein